MWNVKYLLFSAWYMLVIFSIDNHDSFAGSGQNACGRKEIDKMIAWKPIFKAKYHKNVFMKYEVESLVKFCISLRHVHIRMRSGRKVSINCFWMRQYVCYVFMIWHLNEQESNKNSVFKWSLLNIVITFFQVSPATSFKC